mmetsp:Transcript_14725/g.29051  ORF Transcript_14725/g.29051 Transcript_14725/m.29051 type:complete len:215 (-) Transcript_14725:590-1234(-)
MMNTHMIMQLMEHKSRHLRCGHFRGKPSSFDTIACTVDGNAVAKRSSSNSITNDKAAALRSRSPNSVVLANQDEPANNKKKATKTRSDMTRNIATTRQRVTHSKRNPCSVITIDVLPRGIFRMAITKLKDIRNSMNTARVQISRHMQANNGPCEGPGSLSVDRASSPENGIARGKRYCSIVWTTLTWLKLRCKEASLLQTRVARDLQLARSIKL